MSIRKRTDYIVIHCSATPPDHDIGVKEIRKMHLAIGDKDIGYNRVIRRNGEWEQGRDDEEVGAHVKGYNAISIGICLVGGVDDDNKPEDNFTTEQMETLKQMIPELQAMYPNAIVKGHRDFSPDLDHDGVIESNEWIKVCPCFDVQEWMDREGL